MPVTTTSADSLAALPTPALLLDLDRFDRNVARLRDRLSANPGLTFRPHMKTAKSIDIARRVMGGGGPITVSTLLEAERFLDAGFHDILYAVAIVPSKFERAGALCARGAMLSVILDDLAVADALVRFVDRSGTRLRALIEIDTDGHRGGLAPDDARLPAIGHALAAAGILGGVLTHAGESYFEPTAAGKVRIAKLERDGILAAADRLRAEGLAVPVISVGSTPTALFGEDLRSVNEVRAGVFMFGDLVMAGIGVVDVDDIALSVLTTVIGHQSNRGRIIVDAGWMALSRDRGTQAQAVDQGYGLVRAIDGSSIGDLIVQSVNQEHGIVGSRDGRPIDPASVPIDSRLRILPNHACATAAQHSAYRIVHSGNQAGDCWQRFNHW